MYESQMTQARTVLNDYSIPKDTVDDMLSVASQGALEEIANKSGVFEESFFKDFVIENYSQDPHRPGFLKKYVELWSENINSLHKYLHKVLTVVERGKSPHDIMSLKFNS